MSTIYIIHWYNCTAQSFCIPWIKQQLELLNYHVATPTLPLTDHVALDEKVEYLAQHYSFTNQDTIIGISMGSMVALRLLEQQNIYIKHFISVCGAYEFEVNELKRSAPRFKNYIDYFTQYGQPQRDIPTIKSRASRFDVIMADHDQTVSNWNSDKLAHALGVRPYCIISIEDHFRWTIELKLLDTIITLIS